MISEGGVEHREVSDGKTTYQGWYVERMDEDHLPRMVYGENG